LWESEISHYEFVQRSAPSFFRVAFAILGEREHVEEIVEYSIVKALFLAKGRDTPMAHFARIYGIVVKRCFLLASPNPSPVKSILEHHPRRGGSLLIKALARIPSEDRCLLLLRELEGHSVMELCEATGLDEVAINERLLVARRRLARILSVMPVR
jgi:RNA polymerase sigma-70 factor (ECF subfamily)